MSPASPESGPKPELNRNRRKTEIGRVATAKMSKTRRVEVERLVPHPKYGKLLRFRTICYVHDEANESLPGDMVEIMETRPLSKLKRWRLVRVVRPGAQKALELAEAEAKADSQA